MTPDIRILDCDEIDEQVAQEVMGWHYGEGDNADWWLNDKGLRYFDAFRWMPSCDIGCAWHAVKRFPHPQFYVRLVITVTGNWRCDIELKGGDGPVVSAVNEDAAMAICMAALKAVRTK